MRSYAMITGATKNAGYAIAERFLKEDWNVLITSREAERAREAADALGERYGQHRAFGLGMDPADVASVRAAFCQADKVAPRLRAFVANAANLGQHQNLFSTTEDEWNGVMHANVRGAFFGCQEAVKRMDAGAAICVVGSVHSHACLPDRIVYATSKGALNAFVRAAAVELGHLGVRVNSLIAGAIWVDRWEGMTEAQTAQLRADYPLGRESQPEDIANAVYFLCSDQSATMTGSEMTVDSGFLCPLGKFDAGWRPEKE